MNDNKNALSNAMKITVGKRYEVVGQDIYGAGKSHIVEVIARNGDEIIVKTDTGLVGDGVVDVEPIRNASSQPLHSPATRSPGDS